IGVRWPVAAESFDVAGFRLCICDRTGPGDKKNSLFSIRYRRFERQRPIAFDMNLCPREFGKFLESHPEPILMFRFAHAGKPDRYAGCKLQSLCLKRIENSRVLRKHLLKFSCCGAEI